MSAPLPPPPKRILLIRLSAFGDVVIATGLLHALRRAHPQAEIDWLVQPEFAELLGTQAAIAQVIVWERKHWRALLRAGRWIALWQAVRALRHIFKTRDYDWVIDAQGLLKSRALARLAGGRLRIGYDSKEPGRHWLHRLVQRHPEAHAARRFIGDEHAPMLAALNIAHALIPALELLPAAAAEPYLVAAPFTTRPQKHWPESHWVALLGALAAQGHRVVLLGGPGDHKAAARITATVASPLIDSRVGKTSFVTAAELIAGASAVIGVDTGLTHLGFALGRPSLALFGSTRPYAAAREAGSAVLYQPLACAPCGRHPSCAGRWDCMAQLKPDPGSRVRAALTWVLPKVPSSAHRSSPP